MSRSSIKALGLLLLLTPRLAAADDFQAHRDAATRLFQERDYEGALREFRAAYEQRQLPLLLVNMGRTYFRMGRAREALQYYEQYLRVENHPEPQVQGYIEQARAMLALPGTPLPQAPAPQAPAPQAPTPPAPSVPVIAQPPPRPPIVVSQPPAPPRETAQPAPDIAPVRPNPALAVKPMSAPTPPLLQATPPRKDNAPPLYHRWWFWTAIGAVAAGGAAGIAVAATRSSGPPANLYVYYPYMDHQ